MGEEGFEGSGDSFDEFVLGFGDEVPEPVGLEAQPETFDGVEVRRVAGQELMKIAIRPV